MLFAQVEVSKINLFPNLNQSKKFKRDVDNLLGNHLNEKSMGDILLKIFYKHQIQNPYYVLDKTELSVYGVYPEAIKDVKFITSGKKIPFDFEFMFPAEGDRYTLLSAQKSCTQFITLATRRGFFNPQCTFTYNNKILEFKLDFEKKDKVKSIEIETKSPYLRDVLIKEIAEFKYQYFDQEKFRLKLDALSQLFISQGYYLSNISAEYKYNENEVAVKIVSHGDEQFIVKVDGVDDDLRELIRSNIRTNLSQRKNGFDEEGIKATVDFVMKDNGYIDTKITSKIEDYALASGEKFIKYSLNVSNYTRRLINEMSLTGNSLVSSDYLFECAKKTSPEKIKYLDEKKLKLMKKYLKQCYYDKGFLTVEILDPLIIPFDKNMYNVIFRIKENQLTTLGKISFLGVDDNSSLEIKKRLSFQEGFPFNPLEMSANKDVVINYLKEQGYLEATISNYNESMLDYKETIDEVDLKYSVEQGKKYRLEKVIILGLNKTKFKLIHRKWEKLKNSTITALLLNKMDADLRASNLFQKFSLDVVPNPSEKEFANIVVNVQEKKYGTVELSPGFRTDLGAIITGKVSYDNLWGMDRSISLLASVNERFTNSQLNEKRPALDKKFLEYKSELKYTDFNILNSHIDYNISFSNQLRRYYNFDANLTQLSNLWAYNLSPSTNLSLEYLVESIQQKNALNTRDNDSFQVESIIPSFSFDKRNNNSNPTKGIFSNFSVEIANNYFRKNTDVDYIKLLSRNKLYIPYNNGALALSLALGFQKNNSNEYTLPSIKILRLSSVDVVRGYSDAELNYQTKSNKDVSELLIKDSAYLLSFKLEPRFFINKDFMVGAFFDAGRVGVDMQDPFSVNSSVGISFKYITPVGSINLDYGHKLHRRDLGGAEESPGRVHLSIGFF